MDCGSRLLAAKYIRRQAKQLASQLEGVRAAEDIEFVHRARVATRRLRAALRMFDDCFTRKQIRRWRKAVRRTAGKLGSARDRDVQIELLCGTLATLNARECFPGISRILVQLEREREDLQRKVVSAVDRIEADGVLCEMQRVTKKTLRKGASWAENVQTPAVCLRTERQVLRQLDQLLRQQGSLANPEDRESHHAMRIAAKRLRYTLEIARPVHAGRLDEFVEATKRVQSLLGDVHDCDVWVDHLDAFASKERRRITSLFGHAGRLAHLQAGIDHLREDRRRHRCEVFGQLVEYWAELAKGRLWERLTNTVVAHGDSPAAAAPTQPATEVLPASPMAEPKLWVAESETPPSADGANGERQPASNGLLKKGTGSEQADSNAAENSGSEVPVPLFQPAPKPLLTTGS